LRTPPTEILFPTSHTLPHRSLQPSPPSPQSPSSHCDHFRSLSVHCGEQPEAPAMLPPVTFAMRLMWPYRVTRIGYHLFAPPSALLSCVFIISTPFARTLRAFRHAQIPFSSPISQQLLILSCIYAFLTVIIKVLASPVVGCLRGMIHMRRHLTNGRGASLSKQQMTATFREASA
jgi:hypothetical protein